MKTTRMVLLLGSVAMIAAVTASSPALKAAPTTAASPARVSNFLLVDQNLVAHELYRLGDAPAIVLLTDGWQTAPGSPADALPAGIRVSYVRIPPSATASPAVVHALGVPPIARAGERIDVTVDLQAMAAARMHAHTSIFVLNANPRRRIGRFLALVTKS